MAYLADWFNGNGGTWGYQDDPIRGGPPTSPPPPVTPPNGGTTQPPGSAPSGPPGATVTGQAGPGTGFVPLAAYFAPNREGATALAQGLMNKYPTGSYDAGATTVAGPTGPMTTDEAKQRGYKERSAQSAAEAGSELSNMNPLDAFLAQQAGGQGLFDRLAQWAQPYVPPPPPSAPDYGTPPPPPPAKGDMIGGAMGGAAASAADADAIRKRNEERNRQRRERGY